MSISFHDVERLQALYPDRQIELREGKLIIMNPSDSVSGEVGARFSMLLSTWVYTYHLGRILDSSTGFRLPLAICSLQMSRLCHESDSSIIPAHIFLWFLN
jgi:Uma2 family endonuclease